MTTSKASHEETRGHNTVEPNPTTTAPANPDASATGQALPPAPSTQAAQTTPPPAPASQPPSDGKANKAGTRAMFAQALREEATKGSEQPQGQERGAAPATPVEAPAKPAESAPGATSQEASAAPQQAPATATPPGQAGEQEPPPDWKAEYEKLQAQQERERVERELALEKNKLAQMSQAEKVMLSRYQSDIAPDLELYQEIQSQHEEALAEGDNEAAARYYRQGMIVFNRLQRQEQAFQSSLTQQRQTYASQMATQRDQELSARLKDHGLTLDDLKKADPKAFEKGFGDFWAVLDTTTKLIVAKEREALKAEKDRAANLEKDLRQKWQATSPAATPDTGAVASGATAQDNLLGIGPGKAFAQMRAGLREIAKPKG